MNFWRSCHSTERGQAAELRALTRRSCVLAIATTLSLVGASCSASFSIGGQSVEEAAVELIEGDLAELIGLPLVAECPEVVDPDVGTEFSCTATSNDGRVAGFDVLVDREDHIDVQTTNVITAESVPKFVDVIVSGIDEESGGAQVAVDCGDQSIIADESDSFTCDLTGDGADPGASVLVTVTDFKDGTLNYETNGFVWFVPENLAVELIEGDLASSLGIEMAAACPGGVETAVGTEFLCTGTTPDGRVVEILGLVDEPNHIDLNTTNLIRGEVLVNLEEAAANVLEPQTGPVVLDCGRETVVLDTDAALRCGIELVDGSDSAIAVLTFTDIDAGDFTITIE